METRPPARTSGGKFITAMRPTAPSMAIQAVMGVGWDLRLGVVSGDWSDGAPLASP